MVESALLLQEKVTSYRANRQAHSPTGRKQKSPSSRIVFSLRGLPVSLLEV
ncbi:hypothetical protein G7050_16840 [Dysgonomonas sp. HDW5A]|uniref:hypothetical protein n=1 Tax=Dysgonomonas sp. HDW5A TaxID=2714926 RepID=UPI00140AD9CC|nr:hypothetical protein [Dysgonomonas sp. HDW5A]QIK61418.1 hypothetical protein G7050_16840 [Dysgonomonas sp. HDW5A]